MGALRSVDMVISCWMCQCVCVSVYEASKRPNRYRMSPSLDSPLVLVLIPPLPLLLCLPSLPALPPPPSFLFHPQRRELTDAHSRRTRGHVVIKPRSHAENQRRVGRVSSARYAPRTSEGWTDVHHGGGGEKRVRERGGKRKTWCPRGLFHVSVRQLEVLYEPWLRVKQWLHSSTCLDTQWRCSHRHRHIPVHRGEEVGAANEEQHKLI